ncbi:hypothetical protein GMORB2_2132 [Geosmithia morbida]|uniref:Uncharacterized protein n=1 Tax=Geosmithia morbida TaxID=1094350 RepID=A0A9P4YR04_9HYPO|nr:uncharacterized protein GMORB2_2132 [Geosmithia morbida]KAF4121170.1 hypothetical protein GMORB2_2132 [Geosmithia morbida]
MTASSRPRYDIAPILNLAPGKSYPVESTIRDWRKGE